jgi:hypothetical protein
VSTTKENPLGTYRKNAAIAGVLFFLGTIPGAIVAGLSYPVSNVADYLLRMAPNENLITLGMIIQFIAAISCASISVALYPILKEFSEGLAIGAVGFRLAENILQILKVVGMFILLTLSREFIRAGAPATSSIQGAAEIVKTASAWMTNGPALICFSIGAAMYYIVFYRHRLVPRWLSGWGLVGIGLIFITSILVTAEIVPAYGTAQGITGLPMVFAVWLIAKWVNPPAVPSRTAQENMN